VKKKLRKRTPEEIRQWEAAREARIRQLNEIAARGQAELEARRKARQADAHD